MTFTKFAFFFLLSLFFQCFVQAQDWTSYQSPNQVNDLVDIGNELLLATDNGLVVIDKTTFERTTFNKSNSSLSNNHIQSITLGMNNSVWVGTYDIVLFPFDGTGFGDPTVPTIDTLNQNANLYDLKIAPNGDFWVGTTDGVLHREGENWSRFAEETFGVNYFETWDLEIKDNGEVFAAGFDLHHLINGEWINITEGTQLEGYLGADLFTSSTGDLFVSGDLDQIGRFDGQAWQEYEIEFNGSEVIGFTEDTEGNVYFSTQRNGLFKLENDTWVLQADTQTAAASNIMSYFHIDADNNRWMNRNIHLSVNENGDLRSTLIAEHTLENNNVGNVHKGENGKLYFITRSRDNLSVLNTDGSWSFLPKPPTAMPFEFLNDFLVLADDNIWLASNEGLYQYNGSEWTFTDLEQCSGLDIDSQGKIYIRSANRIYIVDNGVISEYNSTNSSLTSVQINAHGVDDNDNLWIGTGDFDQPNLVQTVSSTGEWTTYTAADHPVIGRLTGDFHFDINGNVWVNNDPLGILKFDGTSWTNPVLENREEITNTFVHSIESDADGKMYFAHEYGVTTLLDGEWDNLIIEGVTTNNSSDSNIEFADDGTLWWANGRTGVFSYKPIPTSTEGFPFQAAVGFALYPNPAQHYTTIDFTTKENAAIKVAIYNQLGQLATNIDLGQFPEGTYQQEINIDRLPTGFYTVQLQVNGSSSTRKLIIE